MISIRNLEKTYRNETTIRYRDLDFETGKSYMLLGASGCGKSTLLNMIAGILSPDAGQILLDGEDISKWSRPEKDRFRIDHIGYIFQDFKLIEKMTVIDNIDLLRLEKVDVSDADRFLASLGIRGEKYRRVDRLSGGQKQRVAIVRALVKRPDILLADEPTGNLNFSVGEQVVKELTLSARGKTLITVSHDDRLARYFDEVIDMDRVASFVVKEERENA